MADGGRIVGAVYGMGITGRCVWTAIDKYEQLGKTFELCVTCTRHSRVGRETAAVDTPLRTPLSSLVLLPPASSTDTTAVVHPHEYCTVPPSTRPVRDAAFVPVALGHGLERQPHTSSISAQPQRRARALRRELPVRASRERPERGQLTAARKRRAARPDRCRLEVAVGRRGAVGCRARPQALLGRPGLEATALSSTPTTSRSSSSSTTPVAVSGSFSSAGGGGPAPFFFLGHL